MSEWKINNVLKISYNSSINCIKNIQNKDNLKYYTTLYKLPKYLENVIIIYFIILF